VWKTRAAKAFIAVMIGIITGVVSFTISFFEDTLISLKINIT